MNSLSTCPNLDFTISGGVARIVLNRPERMNAFTFAMIDAWAAAGAGDASTGADFQTG